MVKGSGKCSRSREGMSKNRWLDDRGSPCFTSTHFFLGGGVKLLCSFFHSKNLKKGFWSAYFLFQRSRVNYLQGRQEK